MKQLGDLADKVKKTID